MPTTDSQHARHHTRKYGLQQTVVAPVKRGWFIANSIIPMLIALLGVSETFEKMTGGPPIDEQKWFVHELRGFLKVSQQLYRPLCLSGQYMGLDSWSRVHVCTKSYMVHSKRGPLGSY